MPAALKLEGKRFGFLTVIRRIKSAPGSSRWIVRCDCGADHICLGQSLVSGHTTSCGCKRRESVVIHGASYSAEYRAWQGMIQRCHNPKNPKYKHYGARGITVCERWRNSASDFLSDVGPRPAPGYSIDRWPNNDGNYEPGNVRWATVTEQNENRRSNGLLGSKWSEARRRNAL